MMEDLSQEHCKNTRITENCNDGDLEAIWDNWHRKWTQDSDEFTKNPFFCNMFKMAYNDIKNKANDNRDLNFLFKGFLMFLILITAILILILVPNFLLDTKIAPTDKIAVISVYGLSITAILSVIAKWINIKKFQETWSRNRLTQRRLEIEMIKYIYSIEQYTFGKAESKRNFISSVLGILEDNQKMLSKYLETKETDIEVMSDAFNPSKKNESKNG